MFVTTRIWTNGFQCTLQGYIIGNKIYALCLQHKSSEQTAAFLPGPLKRCLHESMQSKSFLEWVLKEIRLYEKSFFHIGTKSDWFDSDSVEPINARPGRGFRHLRPSGGLFSPPPPQLEN